MHAPHAKWRRVSEKQKQPHRQSVDGILGGGELQHLFSLVSVDIEGFRGFNGAQSFPASGTGIFAFGDQGTGKSSFLGAIEWCLFGDLANFKSVESKTQAELVNQHHPAGRCRVKLILEKSGDRIEIEREKEARSRGSTVTVRASDGEFANDDGEAQIFLRLGLTLEDFYRSVHLHQESIRGVLTDKPEARDEAFDRLLGLEDARNLLSALPIGDIRKELQAARSGKEKAEAKLEGAASQVEENVKRAEANAQELDISPENCTLERAGELLDPIFRNLNEVGRETGVAKVEPGELTGTHELDGALKAARKFIRDSRQHLIQGGEVQIVTGRQAALLGLRDRVASLAARKKELESRRANWERDYGDVLVARSRLDQLRAESTSLEERRRQTGALTRILSDALEYFGTYKGDRCPVCGQAVNSFDVARALTESAGVQGNPALEVIEEDIARVHEGERALVQALEEHESIDLETQQVDHLWTDLVANAMTHVAPAEGQDIEGAISAELALVETRLESVATAHQSRERALATAEEQLEKPKAVLQVLLARNSYERLSETLAADTGQIQAAERKLKDLIDLDERLRTIAEALTGVQIHRSKELISQAELELERLYGVLSGHPYYSQVRIDVVPRSVAGTVKNTYIIRGVNPTEKVDTYVASRYSTGQMNCVALALFLSLTKSAKHRVGFLLLDDPSQNLDTEHKKALANVICELLAARQVVVASQDREFEGFLRLASHEQISVISYEFGQWTKAGPRMKVA